MTELAAPRCREIADAVDALDQAIADLNAQKAEIWADARDELKGLGLDASRIRTTLAGLKGAIARRRALRENPDRVEERDAAIDAMLFLITPRACTHEGNETPHPESQPPAQNEGEAVQVGNASDERSAGTAGTPCTEQSEEFVTTTGAGEAGCDPAADPAPASDDEIPPREGSHPEPAASGNAPGFGEGGGNAAQGYSADPEAPLDSVSRSGGRNVAACRDGAGASAEPGRNHGQTHSPERAPEVSRTRSAETGGSARPEGLRAAATEKPLSVTSPGGEQPGTPSASRRAAEAAVRARLAPKPLHPGDPLYEIRLAAREGRRLGTPAEVAP